ncbi:MAG: hypothetical protein ACPHUF_13400 [Gammaproteobacteria bacterium]
MDPNHAAGVDDCHSNDEPESTDGEHCSGCGDAAPASISKAEAGANFSIIHTLTTSPPIKIRATRYPVVAKRHHLIVRRTPVSEKVVLLS